MIGKLFQSSLMFGDMAELPTSECSTREVLPSGRLGPLSMNIELGWKVLPGMNTLAYNKHS